MTAFVLLHGFAQTPRSWNTVARALQETGHRTYALDLYGAGLMGSSTTWSGGGEGEPDAPKVASASGADCGTHAGSGGFASGFAPAPEASSASGVALGGGATSTFTTPVPEAASGDSLASLAAVCDRVAATVRLVAAVEGAPVLVGYSMGGRIAAETLVRHPGLPLVAVLLEGAGLGPADEAGRAVLARRNRDWAARLRHGGVGAFMDWWETLPLFASQRTLPAEMRAAVRAERMVHTADELARSLEAWGAQHQAIEADTLVALQTLGERGVSALYLAGARDEKYAALAERVWQADLPASVVPEAGHNVHLEQPAAYLEALASILA
ncbi:alpha/beta fold hydrolase [Adlercreutzia sp. R21]|uniref:alpha/beta fold hydrolase n=1 Tax=Adlercreutzia wanghongyangiae TaxID=3111451 RepID=UPI002DBC4405|nr:alpha/beta fold hydrolase [Adlercreutzia sp. R21]MEC4184865.1 alpha/beta fold hydrolase [Adlercreutzia sp. R21]